MMWSSTFIDVRVEYDDFMRAHEEVLERNGDPTTITVSAEVDIDEVLDDATQEQIRQHLEFEGYTPEQLDAIQDCFAALTCGDVMTAEAMLPRIFEHQAQIRAAENGLRTLHRRAA
jgi:hypothetical protein